MREKIAEILQGKNISPTAMRLLVLDFLMYKRKISNQKELAAN